MKKIFKGIAILAATAAVGTGVAFATGCGGTDGTYHGEYHYMGAHGSVYGIVVEVTVKDNIITKVKNLTNSDDAYAKSVQKGESWTFVSAAMPDYGWDKDSVANWTSHENWLMQQYEGRSVAEVMDVKVYTDYAYKSNGNGGYVQDYGTMGEPCAKEFNSELLDSGLIIVDATQGSGRVLLAVQDALK